MGIEPTCELVTRTLVLKDIRRGRQYPFKTDAFPCNPFSIKGFPVFPVSVGIGKKRIHPEPSGHKKDIRRGCEKARSIKGWKNQSDRGRM
jgi:hypothetical protein